MVIAVTTMTETINGVPVPVWHCSKCGAQLSREGITNQSFYETFSVCCGVDAHEGELTDCPYISCIFNSASGKLSHE